MRLSEVSIQRPVLATVMSLTIVIFGLISLTRLPIREYPDIDPPVVSIVTFYRGASASVVETEITDKLEEEFASLEGVKTLSSSSQEQGSVITIEFELSRDVAEAANDVRDRVSRIRGNLPQEAEDPIVEKVDTNAQPIFWLALSSERFSGLEISEVADVVLKERLQKLTGVGSVIIGAERRYAMRVWLDPARLASFGVTVQDVARAVQLENAEIPAGRVEGVEREFAVRTRGELASPEEFRSIIVAKSEGGLVRLGDVARVEVGPEDERSLARYNGRPCVGIGIGKQSKASTVEVAQRVREALPELRKLIPEGMLLEVAYDSATYIEQSIQEVTETIFVAVGLVVLVILLFLKSFRATLLPTVAIPISIVGAFFIAYVMGFTINILTLLAFVLAIGIVVDDAIVMLENVYRHLEMGKSRMQAARDGAAEIGFAIVATTIALVAVFVPVAFLQGNVGRLFNEFGLTLAVSVLISGFVALTLTPMLASRILRPLQGASQSAFSRAFDAFFDGLDRVYASLLRASLRLWPLVIVVSLLLVVGAVMAFWALPKELVPTEDRGIAFGFVLAPEGSTLAYTDRYLRQIEKVLLARPEHAGLFTAIGLGFGGPGRVTDGIVFFRLKEREEREKSQQEVVQELFPQTFAVPGVLAFLINPPSLGGQFSSNPVELILQADTYDELGKAVAIVMAEGSKLGYLVNLDTDLRLNKPQLDVTIDRDRANELGVSVSDIGTTLESLLGGRVTSQFKRGSKQYDVILQLDPSDRSTPHAIEEIYVRGSNGLVQLASVVDVSESVAPKELNHYSRVRSARVTANLAPGISLGKALSDMDAIAERALPAGVRTDYGGQSREFRESGGRLYILFVFSVLFIYLVLAAQFESFVHPFTILLAVPLAVVGALFSLLATGQSLNIYSQIGLIMLVGLVTKNSILIVEFANQLREQGKSIQEAVAEAARIRLRPILMTSLSTVCGTLPIALALGAGGEARQALGIAIVGGMVFSTAMTLLVVPVVYKLLGRFTKVHAAEEVPAIAAQPTPAHA